MRYVSLLRRVRLILGVLVLLGIAVAGISISRSAAVQRNQTREGKQKFQASLRDGVGNEVTLARQGDDEINCRASANSLSNFMFKRSGAKLNGPTKNRLAKMEASTLAGATRRITPDELADILATTAVERISSLTDGEIDHAAETLRGFDAPDLPDSFRRGRDKIKLRASIAGTVTPQEFSAQAKAIRGSDSVSKNIFHGAAKIAAGKEIHNRAAYLSEAIPENFGTATDGLTPIQAVLITYSVASDDLLMDSEANLQKRMRAIQDGITRVKGQTYASPDGHFAYGVNGYLFSTPLDLVFDDHTVNLLLDHIQERS